MGVLDEGDRVRKLFGLVGDVVSMLFSTVGCSHGCEDGLQVRIYGLLLFVVT